MIHEIILIQDAEESHYISLDAVCEVYPFNVDPDTKSIIRTAFFNAAASPLAACPRMTPSSLLESIKDYIFHPKPLTAIWTGHDMFSALHLLLKSPTSFKCVPFSYAQDIYYNEEFISGIVEPPVNLTVDFDRTENYIIGELFDNVEDGMMTGDEEDPLMTQLWTGAVMGVE